jgi:hypothetical protein
LSAGVPTPELFHTTTAGDDSTPLSVELIDPFTVRVTMNFGGNEGDAYVFGGDDWLSTIDDRGINAPQAGSVVGE